MGNMSVGKEYFVFIGPGPNPIGESVEGSSQTPFTNESFPSVSNTIPQTQCSNDSVELKGLLKDLADRQNITSYKSNILQQKLNHGNCYRIFATELATDKEPWNLLWTNSYGKSYGVLPIEYATEYIGYGIKLGYAKLRFVGVVHVHDTSSMTLKNAIVTCLKLSYSQVVNVVCASCKRKDLLREQARERVQKGLVNGELETGKCLNQETTLNKMRFTFQHIDKFDEAVCGHSYTLDMEDLYVGARNSNTSKTNRFHFEVEIFNTVVDMQLNEYGYRFSETSTQLLQYMGALSPCDIFAEFDQSKLLKFSKIYKYDVDDSDRIEFECQLQIFYHSCIKDDYITSLKEISNFSRVMVSTWRHHSYPLVYRLLKLILILPIATATVERCFSKMKLVKIDLRNKIGDGFLNNALLYTLDMEDLYVGARNSNTSKTNRFHFEVEIFNTVVDMQLNEYGYRFSETSTQLLQYMGALSPCDIFAEFDQSKLLKFSKIYKYDVDDSDRIEFECQLQIFYHSCIKDDCITSLKEISNFSRVMVSTWRHHSYPLVYRLLKLILILPVATATVERCFSKMKLVKIDLRNKIGDEFLNNALLCHVEDKILVKVEMKM
ncbi:hypothetical protein LXL04_023103 [Taraxacum kok-saghyz]